MAIGSSTSIMGPNIPASTRDTFSSHLASYNMWALQGERGWAGGALHEGRRGCSPWERRAAMLFSPPAAVLR